MVDRCDTTRSCIFDQNNSSSIVLKHCYESPSFNNNTFICDCELWYGFVGDNCSDLSSQTQLFQLYTLLLVFAGIIGFLFTFWLLIRFAREYMRSDLLAHRRFGKEEREKNIMKIAAINFLAIFVLLLHHCFNLATLLFAENVKHSTQKYAIGGDLEVVVGSYDNGLQVTFFLANLLLCVNSFLILIYWGDVVMSIAAQRNTMTRRKSNNFRNGLLSTLILPLFLSVVFLALGFRAIGNIFLAFANIAVIIFTLHSYRSFLLLFVGLSVHTQSKLSSFKIFVSKHGKTRIVLSGILFLSIIVTSVQLNRMYESLSPGDINSAVIFYLFALTVLFLSFIADSWLVFKLFDPKMEVKTMLEDTTVEEEVQDGNIFQNTYTRRVALSHPLQDPATITKKP